MFRSIVAVGLGHGTITRTRLCHGCKGRVVVRSSTTTVAFLQMVVCAYSFTSQATCCCCRVTQALQQQRMLVFILSARHATLHHLPNLCQPDFTLRAVVKSDSFGPRRTAETNTHTYRRCLCKCCAEFLPVSES